jgi:hypothetical protein
MKSVKISWLALVTIIALGGARCGSSSNTATATVDIPKATISIGIKYTNEPEVILETIPASSKTIYLSAEVVNPTRSTEVRVSWYKNSSQPIANETFSGKRVNSGNKLDFDYKQSSSWLASSVERPGLSWTLGEYRAEVYLNGKLAKTVFFTVVSDSEAEQSSASKAIQSISFGDIINDSDSIVAPKTTFARDTATIYLQLGIGIIQPSTTVEVGVRHVKSGILVNTFSSVVTNENNLLLSLPRDRFGRLWSDKLWPAGSFEVTVKVNGTVARTSTFVVKE